jgi:LEA14-like dessication related protein
MGNIVRTRLKLISGSVQSLSSDDCSDVVLKPKANEIDIEEARVVSSKLKVTNEIRIYNEVCYRDV